MSLLGTGEVVQSISIDSQMPVAFRADHGRGHDVLGVEPLALAVHVAVLVTRVLFFVEQHTLFSLYDVMSILKVVSEFVADGFEDLCLAFVSIYRLDLYQLGSHGLHEPFQFL